jgi:hypothetical protein
MEFEMKKFALAFAVLTLPVASLATIAIPPSVAAAAVSKLGDLSAMREIVSDTLKMIQAGDAQGAVKRITDYESAWDAGEKRLKKLDPKTWHKIDEASDTALSTVRYPSATADEKKKDLADLIAVLDNPS